MPESVTDRPTRSHEYIFLLSKRASYYFDQDAVREKHSREWWRESVGPKYMTAKDGRNDDGKREGNGDPSGRNIRSVWQIVSEPTPEAHFATFPQKLVEPCVLAGTSAKGECVACGANWVREVEISYEATIRTSAPNKGRLGAFGERAANMTRDGFVPNRDKHVTTTGWRATCSCNAGTRPNLVFDPFLGSGTVGIVADKLGRRWAGTELNPKYVEIAKRRTFKQIGLGLAV